MQKNDPSEEDSNYQFHVLKYDKKVQEYLTRYNTDRNDQFLKDYVRLKITFMKKGEAVAEFAQQREVQILEIAQECLLDIQLKKLFDVMLQWNANLFKHESIEISRDFEQWEHSLLICPFLSPISKEEFDLYLQYAQSTEFDYESDKHFFLLQKYLDKDASEQRKEDVEELEKKLTEEMDDDDEFEKDLAEWDRHIEWDDNAEVDQEVKWTHLINQPDFPAWFAFNNKHTNNGDYLNLPQIRAVKEHFYLQLEAEQNERELNEVDEDDDTGDDAEPMRPAAVARDFYTVKKFIMACEDKDVLDKFTKYYDIYSFELWQYSKERERHAWLEANAREAFDNLIGMKKLVPSFANKDWRKALIDAHKEFKKQEIIKALPIVYSDYCMRLSTGVGFDWEAEREKISFFAVDFIRSRILKGRLLNGEPEDFDF